MHNALSDAMNFRHACKEFDASKTIPEDQLHMILEAGRKSPSSFGMEAWKFLVISNPSLKEKIRPLCWNQVQITSCSHLVIILAGIDSVKVASGEVAKRFKRRQLPEEKFQAYMKIYSEHLKNTLSSNHTIYQWTSKQTYIAMANMMSMAAYMGIDSCPIEGFEKEKLEKLLGLDTEQYQISVVLPLGYRLNTQSTQHRLSFEEVVEFIQ